MRPRPIADTWLLRSNTIHEPTSFVPLFIRADRMQRRSNGARARVAIKCDKSVALGSARVVIIKREFRSFRG